MIRHRHLSRLVTHTVRIRPFLAPYSSSDEASGSNVAQGDTVYPSSGREIANAKKGDELVTEDSLKYVTIQQGAQAFEGDLRSTSGLGLGDGLYTHTAKWNEVSMPPANGFSPMFDVLKESQACARSI